MAKIVVILSKQGRSHKDDWFREYGETKNVVVILSKQGRSHKDNILIKALEAIKQQS